MIVCPNCEFMTWEFICDGDEEPDEYVCPKCDNPFLVEQSFQYLIKN